MALDIWTQQSGYSFGTISERTMLNNQLPVTYENIPTPAAVKFSVISGALPPGTRIVGDKFVGTIFEVPRITTFRFVLRAAYNGQVSDRTFSMTVEGPDDPEWTTASGLLPVGTNKNLYVLDSTYIDFQLDGLDYDTATGQKLEYSIFDGDGELPPGLMLTTYGRIVGFIQPLLAIPVMEGNGNYDTSIFDTVAYDYGFRPGNGFDSFVFDITTYDLSLKNLYPKKLNRNYEFMVTITDGDTAVKRRFRIYVVGEDHFRADSTVNEVGEGTYTADASYVKAPIWVTPANLGFRRANNYQTFKLDIYDDPDNGPVIYRLDEVNPLLYAATAKEQLTDNIDGSQYIRIERATAIPEVGHKLVYDAPTIGVVSKTHNINGVTSLGNGTYRVSVYPFVDGDIRDNTTVRIGTVSKLPPGVQFDTGTAEVFGVIPYMPAITKEYKWTVTATRLSLQGETAASSRTFSVKVLGEIESVVTWNTPADLGNIDANIVSVLSINASTTLTDSVLFYSVIDGQLPNGLSMSMSGEIVGKASQFYTDLGPGLTTFDSEDFTLDGGSTTIDRVFSFTVQVRDALGLSANTRTFTLRVNTPHDRLYSNLVVKPFLKPDQRSMFKAFIRDASIFDVQYIYRLNDPNFGIQNELKMLVYAGIETKTAAEVVSVIGRNHKPKRFKLGDVKIAQAKLPASHTVIYDVIYIDVIDPLEIGKAHLDPMIFREPNPFLLTVDQTNQFYEGPFDQDTPFFKRPDPFLAKVDSNDVFAGDPASRIKYPSSVALWRYRIKQLGITERDYLPLWMKSIQLGSVQELGYVKAIPLCFCKPGTANEIYLNIKHSGFDFKNLDYFVDRYIIDRVTGYSYDKYIAFTNDRTSIT